MSFSLGRLAACVLIVCCGACSRDSGLPGADSKEYRNLVSAFYIGLAGLQTGEDVRAKEQLTLATQIAPGEPASWADLALLLVRQQDFDAALQDAEKARSLAPDNSRIEALLGLIENKRGKISESVAHLKRATELDPKNLKALYALAVESEKAGLFARALALSPSNTALLIDAGRLAAKTGDTATLNSTVAKLAAQSGGWPSEARQQLAAVQSGGNPAVQLVFLRNVLARVPQYRHDLNEVQTPAAFVGEPFVEFLKLPSPPSEPAPPDLTTHFTAAAGGQETGGLAIDLNYDFLMDRVVAGPAGVQFFVAKNQTQFTDITTKTRLPPAILNAAYSGAWAFDVDLDGDLDIVLGSKQGPPVVLRNNGDGTFGTVSPFYKTNGLTGFSVSGADGDVALIDGAGTVHVFSNERLGQFRERQGIEGRFRAVARLDSDFILLREDGSVLRLSTGKEICKTNPSESPTLVVADFDNNGALDLLVGDGHIFLSDGKTFMELQNQPKIVGAAVGERNAEGRLDLVSSDAHFINSGQQRYHWQDIRVRSAKATGDQRINSFGIGGQVEVRSGLLTQTQVIASPLLHFGLGTHNKVELARITWPNGVVQGEFDLKADQEILAQQRLKGSCPWLFAWDGKQMSFVKDGSPWSPALGLHINAQGVAGIGQTQEWFKIPGESLKPHDGYYDLRVTGELWETYYIDHYSLMVVDHPDGTAIYTDERFAVPAPPLKIYTTAIPQPFGSVHDDLGNDVGETVRALDQQYLDTFGRGQYQGLTRDHWVDLELPADAPSGPLHLLATGWLHPTDATVNIAIGQSSIAKPRGLSIEVPDAQGHWHTVQDGLGFPAGKMKTIVLDIPVGARKLRLRTNLEIYWDKLEWAADAVDRNRIQHLPPAAAELRYRGFSEVKAANASSPELPEYNRVVSTLPIWRDLEGYATRYGDVRELLERIDDRMVIVNAGDEVRLRFTAQPPPPAGWKRDYVMVADGWIKDGDFNTTFSRTVLPLPYHGMKGYTTPPGRLEDDPAYKLHPEDWRNFHTRYVTALRN